MATFHNAMKITSITYRARAHCFCPLGKAWYTNQFTIQIDPLYTIPDYCEIEKYIQESVEGKTMLIEEAVSIIFDYIQREISPLFLGVSSDVEDAAHGEVTVCKEGGSPE